MHFLEVRAKPCTVPTDARFPAPKSRYKWGYFGPPNWYNNVVFSSWSLYKAAKTNIYIVWSRKRCGSCFCRSGRPASVLGLLVGPLCAVFNLANRGFETGLFWSFWSFRAFAILTWSYFAACLAYLASKLASFWASASRSRVILSCSRWAFRCSISSLFSSFCSCYCIFSSSLSARSWSLAVCSLIWACRACWFLRGE